MIIYKTLNTLKKVIFLTYNSIKIGNDILTFSKGKFDKHCVYLNDVTLFDKEYFSKLLEYEYPNMYEDFIKIYDLTGNALEDKVIEYISSLDCENKVKLIYCILYMTMIAEENKKNTKLGKRIKRLAIYKLLVDREPVDYVVNFMRGLDWKSIDNMCKAIGF